MLEDTERSPHFYDDCMRRFALATVICLMVGSCGDGIDEGANAGRGDRGTIDGVTLGTPNSAPDDTGPDTTPDIFSS